MLIRTFGNMVLVCAAILLTWGGAKAQNQRPLREILPYDEFNSLLLYNVGRIPEFSDLWAFVTAQNRSDVLLTGSTLRSLQRWHFLRLQKHSAAEIRQQPPPTLADLQQLGANDVDLIVPKEMHGPVALTLPHIKELDLIDTGTFNELVKAGGPTIEKVAISPISILDPLNGLRHYYEGRLVFESTPSDDFRRLSLVTEGDYSKTVEALRFIRFARNLPEVTPDPASIDLIRAIAAEEKAFFNREDRLEWVIITMQKLVTSFNQNVPELVAVLHQYNLLGLLSDIGVWMPSKHDISQYVRNGALDTRQLSAQDIENARRVFPRQRRFFYIGAFKHKLAPFIDPVIKSTRERLKAFLYDADPLTAPNDTVAPVRSCQELFAR